MKTKFDSIVCDLNSKRVVIDICGRPWLYLEVATVDDAIQKCRSNPNSYWILRDKIYWVIPFVGDNLEETFKVWFFAYIHADPTGTNYQKYWMEMSNKLASCIGTNTNLDEIWFARKLCELDGNDPDKQSKGCGSIIPRDQNYHLWQAWWPLAKIAFKALTNFNEHKG